jgi:rubrerythrin
MTIEQIIKVLLTNTFRHWREVRTESGEELPSKVFENAKRELTSVAYALRLRDGAPLSYYCNECGHEGRVRDLDHDDPRCPICSIADDLGILF